MGGIKLVKNDLKEDFFDTMDQVTSQREHKIKIDLRQERIRIKQFMEGLKKKEQEQQEQLVKKGNGEPLKLRKSSMDNALNPASPKQMNQYVYQQVQQMPKTGKLSRTCTNPLSNVVLKPCQDSPQSRVKQSTLSNMRLNFEKSVKISNFNDPNADDERLLIDDHSVTCGAKE